MEIINWIQDNWALLLAISAAIDALAGFLPDRWLAYIGLIRRVIMALKPGGTKVMLALIGLLIMQGCSGSPLKAPVSVCAKIPFGESVLCDLAQKSNVTLEVVGDLIMVINLRAIKEEVYSADDARKVLETIKKAIAVQSLTASDLRSLILKYVDDYPELILVSRYIYKLDTPQVLTQTDRQMLRDWCDQQLALL